MRIHPNSLKSDFPHEQSKTRVYCSGLRTVHKNICLQSKVYNACALDYKMKMRAAIQSDQQLCYDILCARVVSSTNKRISVYVTSKYARSNCYFLQSAHDFVLLLLLVRQSGFIFFAIQYSPFVRDIAFGYNSSKHLHKLSVFPRSLHNSLFHQLNSCIIFCFVLVCFEAIKWIACNSR